MFKTSFLMGDKETLRKLGMAVGLLDHDTGCRVDTEPAMKAAGVDGCSPIEIRVEYPFREGWVAGVYLTGGVGFIGRLMLLRSTCHYQMPREKRLYVEVLSEPWSSDEYEDPRDEVLTQVVQELQRLPYANF